MSETRDRRRWPRELHTGPRIEWPAPEEAFDWPLAPGSLSRRRFMALAGASAALAAGAACSRPDRGGLAPAARRVPEALPGVTSLYASTFPEGERSYSVLVRTREARPIHVEGNDLDPRAPGVAPLRAIADVLRLYDPDRLRQPLLDGRPATWEDAATRLRQGLKMARERQRPILLLTGASTSPTRRALLGELHRALPTLEHVVYEPGASDAERAALLAGFGSGTRPRPRLDRARVLLACEADPLADDDPALVRAYASRRQPAGSGGAASISRLWVLEGGLTLTGAKADERRAIAPRHLARLALALARRLNARGLPLPADLPGDTLLPFELDAVAREAGLAPEWLARLAEDLHAAAGGQALVLAGPSLPFEAQVAVLLLNAQLGAFDHTLDVADAPEADAVSDLRSQRELFQRMASGAFGAALSWGVNPAYTFPEPDLVRAAFASTPTAAVISQHRDETAALAPIVLAESHWLESWGDHAPARDLLTLQQPALEPLHDTRQGEEVVLDLVRALGAGALPDTYTDYLKARWQAEVHGGRLPVPFERFWHVALHDGVVRLRPTPAPRAGALSAEAIFAAAQDARHPAASGGFDLTLTLGLLHDGRYANNGWLQELPDPITKLTWGNVVTLAPSDASRLRLRDGDFVSLTAGAKALVAPVLVQPGQATGVLTLRLGHGRNAGSVAAGVGVNAFALLQDSGGPSLVRGVQLTPTGGRVELPTTQPQQSDEGRDLVRRVSLADLTAAPPHGEGAKDTETSPPTLFPPQPRGPHKWAMAIDLASCVGCSACVVACQSENNIPVVGPEQVRRGREMHWIRIDRYYAGTPESLEVRQQPMLCQQCDDAPCETVCPVNATTHSPEGLNQMTYNRCVGTRYCANNCPYKVRRFNFLDFTSFLKAPQLLAMNPEVTVRPRGVMEKCTFCVQRIEDVRAQSKVEGRSIRDGEIRPACAVACPAQAIVFGDIQDPESRVAQIARDPRGYHVLEETGARPNVTYLAEVRNPVGLTAGSRPRAEGARTDAPSAAEPRDKERA